MKPPRDLTFFQVNAPPKSTAGFTFNVWYNSGSGLGVQDPLLNWASGESNNQQAVLWVGYSVPGALDLLINTDSTAYIVYQNVTTGSVVPADTWAYVGATYNGATGRTSH